MTLDTLMSERQNAAASATILEHLHTLKRASGQNKNDQAIVLIQACILERLHTTGQIVATLNELGFVTGHIFIILRKELDLPASDRRWAVNKDGVYSVQENGP